MEVIKFGSKSLGNKQAIDQVIDIIATKYYNKQTLSVVVSARGNSTNQLINMLALAQTGQSYSLELDAFITYQTQNTSGNFLENDFLAIQQLLEGVRLLGDYSAKIKDQLIAYGPIISAKYLCHLLEQKNIYPLFVDTRNLIKTDANFGNAQPLESISQQKAQDFFKNNPQLTIVTGFIGSTLNNQTTTLGRNGSNYTAALLANFLNATEVQNFTTLDGIYTANPDWVPDAQKIEKLSFGDANELANFGTTILHAKTIIPLIEKNIPLRILNTFNPQHSGTLISAAPTPEGIKSLTVLNDVSLINLEGRGLLGKTGVDARIFKVMAQNTISVSIISQGSSERGIGIVVSANRAAEALIGLEKEFETDFYTKDVNKITINDAVAVISIIGQDLSTFHKPYAALIKNKIIPILINNTVTGKNISLVLDKKDLKRALNVIHGEIFGVTKKINIVVFGHGLVGATLIDQITASVQKIQQRKAIKLNIFAIANSKQIVFNLDGFSTNWKQELHQNKQPYILTDVITFAQQHNLENLIAVDNTASKDFVNHYIPLIESGFDLVSSNKNANTLSYYFYKNLRQVLQQNQKKYLYETNVGAGLPLIDTIKLLHLSGENITKITGVFSGSLSFLFNHFSIENNTFSHVLQQAIQNGYTEPDPREDLCGNDVARKLLILARELDLQNELHEVTIENLIPQNLQSLTTTQFLDNLHQLDDYYQHIKQQQISGNVLRYVGELSGDLQLNKGNLEVKLISVPQNSALGQLKGSDSIFEIYTESYGERPIIIQGAGAGASVTARGVFGDILRLTDKE